MEEDAEERDGGVDVWATRGDTATDSSSRFGFGLGRIFGTDRSLPGYTEWFILSAEWFILSAGNAQNGLSSRRNSIA